MNHILLPTDFSENSINAMHYALQLFEGKPCHFYLLHTQNPANYISDDLVLAGPKSIYETIVNTAKKKLSQLLVELKQEFKTREFKFELLVDYDTLSEAINQIKTTKPIDLIVMGTNGASSAKEILFGSNTINVIRKVDCPTLVIPEGCGFESPNELLLPLDAADALNSDAFLNAIKFMKRFGKKLHLLRINPNGENSEDSKKDHDYVRSLLTEHQYVYHIVSDIPISATVDCYIQTHTIDLVALIVQNESLFERLFMGSPTTKINKMLKVPLLVFHS
jgi:nucleotide-binding universal stress UspA family protein